MATEADSLPRPDGIDDQVEERSAKHHHTSTLSLLVLGAIVAWGLSGFAGSRNQTFVADAPALTLRVSTPSLIRNGEIYESTVEVTAKRRIGKLVVGITTALLRETTTNAITPNAEGESFEDDLFRFEYAEVEAGASFKVKFDHQINPTLFGLNTGVVAVFDGDDRLADVPVQMRIFP